MLEDRTLLSTYTVTDNSDSPTDTGSLRYAINNAPSGSIIQFASSVGSSITLMNGVLNIMTNLTIQGPGENSLTINGAGATSIFSVASSTSATISGLTLSNGSSTANGGAVTNSGTLDLTNCVVSLSTATTSGGGIENDGTLTATNCTIANNSAGSTAGGIDNASSASLTLYYCTISGNSALNGGGIDNNATLYASGSTISGNHALVSAGAITGDGSGIDNTGGTLTLANCTIANNSAIGTGISPRGDGGGINNTSTGTLTAISSTIAGNAAAGNGGGIANSGSAALANTIVAANTASGSGPDISGTIATNSAYNLIGNGSGMSGVSNGVNGNQVGSGSAPINPLLAPLANYGGPDQTMTMALLPGSPAIDAGGDVLAIDNSLTTDQRGFPRIANGTVDIGAFEVQVYTAYSTAPTGGGSLYTAMTNANQAGGSVIVVTATGLIGLTSSLPPISQDVQILGPGANNLTVSGSGQLSVFNIQSGVTAVISGLTIANGASGASGGAVVNAGTLSLTNCMVSYSKTEGSGGGIDNMSAGTLTATSCTVAYNLAQTNGGGIENDGTMSLINCTIADNQAASSGGGIYNNGALTLSNCTVASNTAESSGGGIFNNSSNSVNLANTIVATNTAPSSNPDVAGAANNVQSSSLIGGNPVIGILQNNGGPTPTMAVLPGSPAIAAGNVSLIPAGITTDQRGVPRTFNGAVDVGAYQSRTFTIAISSGNNQQGAVTAPFQLPLVVSVTSPFGDPVTGGQVTFAAPSTGPSATFPSGSVATIDAAGLTNQVVDANTSAGTYSVTASARGAVTTLSATSVSFTLTNVAGPATQLVIFTQPAATATAGQLFAPQPVVYEEDQYGNLETNDNSTNVTAVLHNTTTALQTVRVAGGMATFTSLAYTKAGSITLDFTSGTLTKATSKPIVIKAAQAVKFALNIVNTNGIFANTPYTIVVQALDTYGNQASGYTGTVELTSSKTTSNSVSGYTFTLADTGVHYFTNGITFKQAGSVTVTVKDLSNQSISGSIGAYVGTDPPAKARVAASKPKSRRDAVRALAASAKGQAHTAAKSLSGNSSGAKADAAREQILAELGGSLRAYLTTEKLAGARLE